MNKGMGFFECYVSSDGFAGEGCHSSARNVQNKGEDLVKQSLETLVSGFLSLIGYMVGYQFLSVVSSLALDFLYFS